MGILIPEQPSITSSLDTVGWLCFKMLSLSESTSSGAKNVCVVTAGNGDRSVCGAISGFKVWWLGVI